MATDQENISRYARKRLRLAREHRGLSQEQLGEAIGKSNANISDIERGRLGISFADMALIAQALNTPLTYFVPGDFMAEIEDFKYQADDVEAARLHNLITYPSLQKAVRDLMSEIADFANSDDFRRTGKLISLMSEQALKQLKVEIDDRINSSKNSD